MSSYSIKDLEKLTGIKAHTIRIWEKRYGIVMPERTKSNIRCYSDSDLKRLLNISILNKRGCRISSLADLSDDELSEKVVNVMTDHHMYDSQIENLVMAMIDLNENKFEKTLSNAIIELGFEETLIKIIYPFFNKVGVLWQTGTISPAQEHFVSNLVRQKIVSAIENLEVKYPPKAKLFLMFLHENEYHELGLLFYSYLIKKTGHKVIYLGQLTPFEDIVNTASVHEPDFLFTAFVTPIPKKEIENYLNKLTEHFVNKKIFLTGVQLYENTSFLPGSAYYIKDAKSFKNLLIDLLR